MSKPGICVLVVLLIQIGTSLGTSHENRHNGEYVSRGTFPLAKKRATTTSDGPDPASTADLLTRLKLLAYEEKLKEKELKKEAKAETKAEKEKVKAARDQALLAAYLSSLNSSSAAGVPPPPYPLLYPSLPLAAPVAGAAPVPIMPMPMYPAIGLWKKQMFLSQLYGGAALAAQAQLAAQAAAAASATTAAPTTVQDSIVQLNRRDALDVRKEKVINQITKRYARYLRKKHGDEDKERERHYKHGKKSQDDDDEDEDDEDEDDTRAGVSGAENRDSDDQFPLSSLSGASNKFGTAPGGNSPVAQAGCSGSHIHVCSGTTFYLNSPENIKAAANDNLPEDLKPDEKDEDNDQQLRKYKSYSDWRKSWRNDEEDDEGRHRKKSKKHGHGHRSRKHKKHGHKNKHEEEDEDKRSNEDEAERSREQEPDKDQEDNQQDNEKDSEDVEPSAPEAMSDAKKA